MAELSGDKAERAASDSRIGTCESEYLKEKFWREGSGGHVGSVVDVGSVPVESACGGKENVRGKKQTTCMEFN